ncbi:MAG: DUF427 domain-containing protein [Sciscionella sp.]
MTIARLDGEVIAESEQTVVIDGKHYFPPQSVHVGFLRPTETRADGHHYSVIVHGKPAADCACCTPRANVPDPRIAEHVTFTDPVIIED